MPEAPKLQFKRGLLQNLPQQIQDGALYVTTDEHSLYMDYGNRRIRIGDFVSVNTLTDLQNIHPVYETALYYVKENNILARYDVANSRWIQINKAGIVAIETSGNGNVISNITTRVDATTGQMYLVITKTSVATTDSINDLAQRVTTLESTSTAMQNSITTLQGNADVAGSVANSIATATNALLGGETTYTTFKAIGDRLRALNELASTVEDLGLDLTSLTTTVSGHTTTLNTLTANDTTEGSIDYKIKQERDARIAADNTLSGQYTTLNATVNDDLVPDVTQLKTDVTTLKGSASTVGSVANTVSTAIAEIVANAPQDFDTLKEISDWISGHANSAAAMNTQITNLGNTVSDLSTTVEGHTTDITGLQTRMTAAEGAIDDLETDMTTLKGPVSAQGSILYMINNATQALSDLIDDIQDDITTLNGDVNVVGSVAYTVDQAVAAEAALRAALETRFNTLYATVEAHGVTLGTHTTQITNLQDSIGDLDVRVTSIESSITWQEY